MELVEVHFYHFPVSMRSIWANQRHTSVAKGKPFEWMEFPIQVQN